MGNREIVILYKGVEIRHVRGSNWAYVGGEVFQSVLGAKQAITRRLAKNNG